MCKQGSFLSRGVYKKENKIARGRRLRKRYGEEKHAELGNCTCTLTSQYESNKDKAAQYKGKWARHRREKGVWKRFEQLDYTLLRKPWTSILSNIM